MPVPCLGARELTLKEVANFLAERLVDLHRPKDGRRPALATEPPFATSPYWQDLLFDEYFHAETGQGLGAAHQTGWTGSLADFVMRRYRKDIREFWGGPPGAASRVGVQSVPGWVIQPSPEMRRPTGWVLVREF